jgi:hypothetical protein
MTPRKVIFAKIVVFFPRTNLLAQRRMRKGPNVFGYGTWHPSPLVGDFYGDIFAAFGYDYFDWGEGWRIMNTSVGIVVVFCVIFLL